MTMKAILFLLLLLPLNVLAASGVVATLNANNAPYNSLDAAQGTSIQNDPTARSGSMFAMVGAYARSTGKNLLELQGQVFEFIWQDGSKERGVVNNPLSTLGVVPVPNTQSKPPGGGVGYTTDPNGGYYGGPNVTGFRAITQTTTVCVGGYCESVTNVIGYEWIYGPGGLPENEVV